MTSLSAWDYTASVATMRPLVARWKTVTVEMLGELYRAREELSRERSRPSVTNETLPTWIGYLDDVGLNRMTVHRWLSQYDPITRTVREIEPPPRPEPRQLPPEPQRPVQPLPVAPEPEPPPRPSYRPEPRIKPEPPPTPEPEPAQEDDGSSTTPEVVIDMCNSYLDVALSYLGDPSARHMVVNALIKRLREMSIELNRKVGVA